MGSSFLMLYSNMPSYPHLIVLLACSAVQNALADTRSYELTLSTGIRSPDGFAREVYLINNQQPGPLIEAEEGDDLEIFVQNDLPVEATIHWHGLLQRGSPDMDGVPGVTQFPIPPGGNFTYRFSTADEYGFYWYHSHFRALLRAAPSLTVFWRTGEEESNVCPTTY